MLNQILVNLKQWRVKMNKLEYKLLTNYLEQLSFRADNSICELQLLKKHVEEFKAQISKRDNSE